MTYHNAHHVATALTPAHNLPATAAWIMITLANELDWK
jgi:hypothetical protein